MPAFGARLQAAREQRGVSLRQIAAATRISMTALEALERDDFSRLPGGIFSRAFIRSYAREVGLDPEVTVNEFLAEVGRFEAEAAIVTPPPVSDADKAFLEQQKFATRVFRAILAVVVIALVTLAIWKGPGLVREFSGSVKPKVSEADARVPDPPPPPSQIANVASTAPDAGAISIEFSVTSDCSVQVSADGVRVYFQVMRAGEHKQLFAQRDLEIQVDNAGAFFWSINGRPAKALGTQGQRQKAHVTPTTVGTFLQ